MFDSHFRIRRARGPLLMLALGCLAAPAAWAQSSFGSVPVATATPPTLKVTVMIATAGTLAATPYQVLTQGAPNLDYTAAATQPAGTCVSGHAYSVGNTCSVTVQFNPRYAGQRLGAVVLNGSSGAVNATAFVQGIGDGPQAAFDAPLQASAITVLGGGFSSPFGVAVDGAGNVIVGDDLNNAVKKIPPGCTNAACTTTLGGGFNGPHAVAVDGAGNVYVADTYNGNAVRKIPAGCAAASCTVALGGGFSYPIGVAVDGAGNVYVADWGLNSVKKIPPGCTNASCTTTLGSGFTKPEGVAVDGAGNVYAADTLHNAVKKIAVVGGCTTGCTVTTLGGGFNGLTDVAVDAAGNVVVADFGNNAVKKIPPGCTAASCTVTLGGGFNQPAGVAVDGAGNVTVADYGNNAVKKIDRATPPSLTFASTPVGSTSSDSPQTATLANIGTQPLNFAIPAGSAKNPVISTSFTWNSVGAGACPNLTSASAPASLASGTTCDLPVSFAPAVTGNPLNGTLVLTDDSLNAVGTTQTIALQGTATLATTTTLAVSTSTPTYGDSVTLTATITVAGSITPTGTVQFTDGANGPVIGSCSAVALSAASPWQANCTTTALAAGSHTVVAVYSGDFATATSSGSTSLTVNQANQTIAFNSMPPGNAAVGGSYAVAATASSNLPVTLSIDTASTAGACSIAGSLVSFTGTGTCIIDANQGGDTNYNAAPQAQQMVAVGFGSVPVATATPPELKVTATITTAGTLATPPYRVLTQGAPNLDYTAAATQAPDACLGGHAYNAGDTCSVTVQFNPRYSGLREGAVVLDGAAGVPIATVFLQGVGDGPQAAFDAPLPDSAITTLGGGFNRPEDIALDSAGNVIVSDSAGNTVTRIPPGCTDASCTTTLGGGFNAPSGVVVDGAGNVYVADSANNAVKKIPVGCTASACTLTLGSGFNGPSGVAVDGIGNVVVADFNNHAVKKITVADGCTTSCTVTTLGGGFNGPIRVAVDGAGNVIVSDPLDNNTVKQIPPGCMAAACTATLGVGFGYANATYLYGVAVDGAGNVYVVDADNYLIMKMAVTGGCTTSCTVTTLQGGFYQPRGLAIDGAGNVYVAVYGLHAVKKIDRATPPSLTFASTPVGSTSSDSPQTATLANIGTQPLNFAIPAGSAKNPAISTSFTWNSAAPGACPNLTSASAPASLASGATCDLPVSFAPAVTGNPLNGTLVLTDDSLNAVGTTQMIALQGTATLATTTTLAVSTSTPTYGDSVTLTATIAVAGSITPTGTVQFTDGANGPVIGNCSAVALSAASPWQATCATTALAAGSHTVVAVYSGDFATATSSGSTSLTVNQANQTIAFNSMPPGNAAVGGSYTVAATASSNLPVTLSIDTASTAGACSIAGSLVSFTGTGTCIIDANQGGDTNYAPANQAQQTLTIGLNAQSIGFTSNPPSNPTVGGSYSVAATATSGLAVAFSIDAASTAGACSIAGSLVSFTGAGTCIIDANQGGDSNYAAAPQAQQPVGIKAGTSIALTTQCMRTFVQAEPFTMTATVTGASPTGNIGFSDGSATLSCSGATPSAPTATCTTTALNVPGTYQLTATYIGDGNNNASTSDSLPVTVLSAADVIFRNDYEVDSADCPIE